MNMIQLLIAIALVGAMAFSLQGEKVTVLPPEAIETQEIPFVDVPVTTQKPPRRKRPANQYYDPRKCRYNGSYWTC
jgi:hypothetical protein